MRSPAVDARSPTLGKNKRNSAVQEGVAKNGAMAARGAAVL